MTELPIAFEWVQGFSGPEPQLRYSKRDEYYKPYPPVLASHKLDASNNQLSLKALSELFPYAKSSE